MSRTTAGHPRREGAPGRKRRPGRFIPAVRLVTAIAAAGAIAATASGVAAAQPSAPRVSRSAVVVKIRTRGSFGRILVTNQVVGRALYILPHGSCTGSCLSVWPRLVMPRGKTVPRGAPCLGTARFGSHGRLQVTYHGHRLYTFTGDSGTSVTGNNVAGFMVARVVSGCG